MISKFSWKAYLPAFIIAVLFAVLVFVGIIMLDPAAAKLILPITPLFLFPVLALVWLIYGECRMKIIRVELNLDHLIIRRYFGLAKPVTWYYADLTGFTLTILPAQNTAYEYLYIKSGDKNIGKLSEFYHKNYRDLKGDLQTRLKDLGYVDFSYLREVKEIFS
ncbi:MAG: hypothetical protein ACXVJB_05845 [Mucilaginibacter sp.]